MRFGFGKNWLAFAANLSDAQVVVAERELARLVGVPLTGKSFLDVGCGSGLMSLAARRLGARVHSMDYDPESVACTEQLKVRFCPGDTEWTVVPGDALDATAMGHLGFFDVIYSWGVLHHTGAMWKALDNILLPLAPGGLLVIAIYNDQDGTSRRWRAVKQIYNRTPRLLRPLIVAACLPVIWWKDLLLDLLRGRPLCSWRSYGERGMSPWHDLVDWVGGYPFEVARPEQIFDFYRGRGLRLERLKTCGGGKGCNEYVFIKPGEAEARSTNLSRAGAAT